MGRIVAAPTAGSCGIIPGLLFAWEFFCGAGLDTDTQRLMQLQRRIRANRIKIMLVDHGERGER